MTSQLVFPMPGFKSLAEGIETTEADLEVGRFGDEELRVRVHGSVGGRECVVIGTVSPPGDSLLALMLAAETLKVHGAHQVTAVLPYLAYGRSDVPDAGGVQSIGVIGRALESAGVDQVITVDAHSNRDAMLFPIPLISLSPAAALAGEIAKEWQLDAVVAPDKGAFERARALADALELDDPLTAGQVAGARRVLVVDDIIDTGKTLHSCCSTLAAHGVDELVIAVTHPVFAGKQWRGLLSLPLRAFYTTDTITDVQRTRPYLTRVVSIAPVLRAALADLPSAIAT